jgi:hypothetical protein
MSSLWWLALPVLLLPVWWHRQKREQPKAAPLATAAFLPRAEPHQVRVWRWTDIALLLVRCMLLAAVIAWLADPVVPTRGDTVLVAQGTDRAFAEREIAAALLKDAQRIELPAHEAIGWLQSHEREWRADARLLVVGSLPMPAALPQFRHRVEFRTIAKPLAGGEHHIAIVSERARQWRRLFAALGEPRRFLIDDAPNEKTELVIWDAPQAPPAGLRAPLWWVGDPAAFPELNKAREIDGMRYADTPRGRVWTSAAWPPKDAAEARKLFETWQRLHYASAPFPMPPQVIAPGPARNAGEAEGGLRDVLLMLAAGLFALERILAHARRR